MSTGPEADPPPPAASAAGTPHSALRTPHSMRSRPSAADVFGWVAAGPHPWFPSRQAGAVGVQRDGLDEPLAELRAAGLVRVADWQKGVGQGYAVAPGAEGLVGRPERVAAVLRGKAVGPTDTPPPRGPLEPTAYRPPAPADAGRDDDPMLLGPAAVMLNVAWFLAGAAVAVRTGGTVAAFLSGTDPMAVGRTGGLSGTDLIRGEWYRLVTACFVHVGILHLLLNVYALSLLGPVAEELWGRARAVAVYAVSGLAGNCLAMVFRPELTVAGASGAACGLLGSAAAWLVLHRDQLDPADAYDTARRLVVVIGLNLVIGLVPQVSWEAHLGGAVAGFLCGLALSPARPDAPAGRRWAGWLAAAALVAGCVLGLNAFAERSDKWRPLWVQEARKQRQAWAAGLAPPTVDAVYREAVLASVAGSRPAAVADKVRRLREAADAAARDVPPVLAAVRPGLTDAARRYAELVGEVAAKLDPPDLRAAADRKAAADRAWAEVMAE